MTIFLLINTFQGTRPILASSLTPRPRPGPIFLRYLLFDAFRASNRVPVKALLPILLCGIVLCRQLDCLSSQKLPQCFCQFFVNGRYSNKRETSPESIISIQTSNVPELRKGKRALYVDTGPEMLCIVCLDKSCYMVSGVEDGVAVGFGSETSEFTLVFRKDLMGHLRFES